MPRAAGAHSFHLDYEIGFLAPYGRRLRHATAAVWGHFQNLTSG